MYEYEYRLASDTAEGFLLIYRAGRKPNALIYEAWSTETKEWTQSGILADLACRAFIGFEQSELISEEEANRLIADQSTFPT
jgi:hypothetical protein